MIIEQTIAKRIIHKDTQHTRYTKYISLLRVLAVCTWFFATPVVVAKPLTAQQFGVVNNQKVIVSIPEGIKARGDLEKYVKEKQAGLQKKKAVLDGLAKEMEQKAAIWNDEMKQNKARDLQTKIMELRQEEQAFKNEAMTKEREATRKIVEKIGAVVKEIAEKKKLFIVYETSTAGIVYMKEYVDITEDVIVELSKTSVTKD